MIHSKWFFIDSQADLDKLENRFFWEDGVATVEMFGCIRSEPYFPEDIARCGYFNLNIHLLVELQERQHDDDPDFVELVLIDCDQADYFFLQQPHFKGRVDSLKRVRIDSLNAVEMSCSRLIYRLIHGQVSYSNESYFLTQPTKSQNSPLD
ncbi:MAG TPA: hypothetical protein V6C72_10430 [Chroococcales cyanobacterium]